MKIDSDREGVKSDKDFGFVPVFFGSICNFTKSHRSDVDVYLSSKDFAQVARYFVAESKGYRFHNGVINQGRMFTYAGDAFDANICDEIDIDRLIDGMKSDVDISANSLLCLPNSRYIETVGGGVSDIANGVLRIINKENARRSKRLEKIRELLYCPKWDTKKNWAVFNDLAQF